MKVEFIRPELPASSRIPCTRRARLPDRDLSEAEVVNVLGLADANLQICDARRAAAVAAVDGAAK